MPVTLWSFEPSSRRRTGVESKGRQQLREARGVSAAGAQGAGRAAPPAWLRCGRTLGTASGGGGDTPALGSEAPYCICLA